MNEKFLELPEEKRLRIINAGMEVFGKYEYKRAVTDDIAAKAGISKGLLFYYFKNKRSLYLYLLSCCNEIMKTIVLDESFNEISDFFELLAHGAKKKAIVLKRYPYCMEFVMKAYYSQNESISDDVQQTTHSTLQDSFSLYFKHINWNKFKEGVEPEYVYRMLVWMSDGYLHEVQARQEPMDVEAIMNDFQVWLVMFKKMIYKEEFQ